MEEVLRILFITDLHACYTPSEITEILLKEMKRRPFDCLLMGGDIVNVKHSTELKDEKANGSLVEGDNAENSYIHALQSLGVSVFWVPGNHDSSTAFLSAGSAMSPGNCHNRIVELRDHLLLLGVGGSGSAILESGEHVWDGFPMNNDLDLTVPYELLSSLSDDDSVILLTHAPASCLPSSRQQKSLDDTPILCGSGKLTFFFHQLLRSTHVPLYLHGHNHRGVGSSLVTENDEIGRASCRERV